MPDLKPSLHTQLLRTNPLETIRILIQNNVFEKTKRAINRSLKIMICSLASRLSASAKCIH